jgi:inosine-uridine nucleoside N-ribohydrolase
MSMPVILDCDPGHDDAAALLLALASDELDLVGVTTVAGNQTLPKTTTNALKVLEYVGRTDVPVAAGADRPLTRELYVAADIHGESGLEGVDLPAPTKQPEPEHAVDWIAKAVEAAAGPITLVPTGPLTNIALLLARYPDLRDKLGPVVLMGGSIGEGNVTPAAEFNIWVDPEAAHRVFTSGLELTMVGLDVTHRALITERHLDRLRPRGRAGRLIADLYSFFIPNHRQRYGWDGAPIHDALAMAHVIDSSLLRTEHRGVVIDTGGELSRGRTYVNRWSKVGWAPNCHVAVDVDSDRFLELLVDRIGSLG